MTPVDRMFFQDAQAEFQDQEFYRNLRKRSQNPGSDSAHCHTDGKVFEFFVESRVAFSTLVTFLKWNLFVYRCLRQCLGQSLTKPLELESFQPEFSFQDIVFYNREATFEKLRKFRVIERGWMSNYTILKVVGVDVLRMVKNGCLKI